MLSILKASFIMSDFCYSYAIFTNNGMIKLESQSFPKSKAATFFAKVDFPQPP